MPLKRSPNWLSGLRPVTEKGSNPKDELGMLKLPLLLVSPVAVALQALCMQDGAEKYGPYNYRLAKVQAYVYLEAALRHIYAIIDGEDFDPKTGKPHIGYALATLGIYADAWVNGFLIDNRPNPGSAGRLISTFSRSPGEAELTPGEITERLVSIIRGNSSKRSADSTRDRDANEAATSKRRRAHSGKRHKHAALPRSRPKRR